MTANLFVYGSLRRGRENHAQLAGARFLAEARTLPEYALRELDGYPILVAGAESVAGELFELDEHALARLDAFEGASYQRAPVQLEGGATASTYLASERALARLVHVHRG